MQYNTYCSQRLSYRRAVAFGNPFFSTFLYYNFISLHNIQSNVLKYLEFGLSMLFTMKQILLRKVYHLFYPLLTVWLWLTVLMLIILTLIIYRQTARWRLLKGYVEIVRSPYSRLNHLGRSRMKWINVISCLKPTL